MRERVLVLYRDGGGMPRAWALGDKSELAAVRERAREELAKYVTKQRKLGEPVTANDFTLVETKQVNK